MQPDINYSSLCTFASPKCPAWQSYKLPEEIRSALEGDGFQKLLGQSIIDFDTTTYPFREDLLSALLRQSKSAGGQQSQQRAAKKQRDLARVTEFQDRLAALPLEKIHLAVNPAATPNDDINIPRLVFAHQHSSCTRNLAPPHPALRIACCSLSAKEPRTAADSPSPTVGTKHARTRHARPSAERPPPPTLPSSKPA
jgi:hypothetical protein